MEISGVVSAILIGGAIGVLGRLVTPGHQHIGVLWTLVVGIAAALIGSALAHAFGLSATEGPDWLEWLLQIVLAALGVFALDRSRATLARSE
jgi:uncharacterized membrane protein YeaQ/YmgE (transglycosylase-associated protein family)